ncbi:MAG: SPOR domain-containing protein [Bacteroidetes bacterium]|nr:SPOR domain-containing protein [Bacteroidota bacterium]
MKYFAILLFILLQINSLFAQHDSVGKVEISQSNEIDKLLLKHLQINSENESIDGFRIQIHFGGEREKAKTIKTKFLQQFPDVAAYEVYQQPNFKVRVGDFRTRLEAQKFMTEINTYFPSAFIVADEIHLPKLE